MSEKMLFDVEIADATGHSVVQMTQEQLVEKAENAQGTWVFVNDQLVNTGDLADMNLNADSRIRLMPGLVGGQDGMRFDVEIADATGHSVVKMTKAELTERAENAQGTWVFVNDQLVNTGDLADMNLNADSRIRLMPGLVGGGLRC
jgi:sulfur carrier protein ThiS